MFSYIMSVALILGASSCSEIEDGVTDIDSWPAPKPTYDPQVYTLNHPCMLHSQSDIDYAKSHMGMQPWSDSYNKLIQSQFCTDTYKASPVKYLARLDATNWANNGPRWEGAGLADEWYQGIHTNYTNFMRDCAAAYQLALKYVLTGDNAAGDCAKKILTDWADVNQGLLLGRKDYKDQPVDPNEYLIMIQMHQCANAAELLRGYNGWGSTDEFKKVGQWMSTHFYPFCSQFLKNNTNNHSWMNWDLASMTAILSIGILTDNQDMINEAILHFKSSEGPGCIMGKGILTFEEDPDGTGEMLAQGNESGRDQGHNTLCATLLGTFCQMAYNIGDNLFSFENGRAIAFAQYVAKYNMVKEGFDPFGTLAETAFKYQASSLPFKAYEYSGQTMTAISPEGRGTVRPGWDIWTGYCKSHGIKCTYLDEYAAQFGPDAGGGNYGSGSGGFDQLGFSTLMNHRE